MHTFGEFFGEVLRTAEFRGNIQATQCMAIWTDQETPESWDQRCAQPLDENSFYEFAGYMATHARKEMRRVSGHEADLRRARSLTFLTDIASKGEEFGLEVDRKKVIISLD